MGYTVPVLIAVVSAIRRPYQPSPFTSAASTASIGVVIRVMGWMLVAGWRSISSPPIPGSPAVVARLAVAGGTRASRVIPRRWRPGR